MEQKEMTCPECRWVVPQLVEGLCSLCIEDYRISWNKMDRILERYDG